MCWSGTGRRAIHGWGKRSALFPIAAAFGVLLSGHLLALWILVPLSVLRRKVDALSSLKKAFRYFPFVLCFVLIALIYLLLVLLVYKVLFITLFIGQLLLLLLTAWLYIRTMWAPVYVVSGELGILDSTQLWKAVKEALAAAIVSIAGAIATIIP